MFPGRALEDLGKKSLPGSFVLPANSVACGSGLRYPFPGWHWASSAPSFSKALCVPCLAPSSFRASNGLSRQISLTSAFATSPRQPFPFRTQEDVSCNNMASACYHNHCRVYLDKPNNEYNPRSGMSSYSQVLYGIESGSGCTCRIPLSMR